MVFMEESELSSKRWASAPRRPNSPCLLGPPTSREAAGPPVQLEPVDLSVKTPVVLQVPRYSPAAAALITTTTRRIPSPSTTVATPLPIYPSTVSPALPFVDVARGRDHERDRKRDRICDRESQQQQQQRQSSQARDTREQPRDKRRDREQQHQQQQQLRERDRQREHEVSVCGIEPPDPVFVSSSAALLALQRIKEASLVFHKRPTLTPGIGLGSRANSGVTSNGSSLVVDADCGDALKRRKVHRCDVAGCDKVYTKSSHQRNL